MTAPICQRENVTVYVNHIYEDDADEIDVYIVFRSGVVMYCDEGYTVLEVMNSPIFNWRTSNYGEQHVRDIFEFIGYFPAPCKELI